MINSLLCLSKRSFSSHRYAVFLRRNRERNRGLVVLFINTSCLQLTLILLISVGFSADAKEHKHGQGQLLISQDGNEWHMQLSLPAADALGFEHEPETEQQKRTLHSLANRLAKNAGVVEPDGQCCLTKAEHTLGNQHEHDPHENYDSHEHDREREHDDIEVEYQFNCKAAVTQISVKIFATMPSLSIIEVQWILENSQGMTKLTRSHPYVQW
jgi:hypothetical protein